MGTDENSFHTLGHAATNCSSQRQSVAGCRWPLLCLLWPLRLSLVTSSVEQRGRPGRAEGGCDVTEHISILRRTHALLREQRVRQYRGGTFWLTLPPSLTTFSFSPPSLSHPLIPAHFHPSPPHFSPSLPPSLLHSVCHPISSILLSFPLLTLPPSLPLYLRLLFFYSKLNLSL